MDSAIIISVLLMLAGIVVGWLAASYRAAQQQADILAEQREVFGELSAAKQQLAQHSHWRDECELLNNELRSLREINTSLEADLREVTTRLEASQDKTRQMVNSEQRLNEQFENLANRIFEHSNRCRGQRVDIEIVKPRFYRQIAHRFFNLLFSQHAVKRRDLVLQHRQLIGDLRREEVTAG
jgi:septal ring factor EnvC (AmiA/AmiB activator)